jgi:hypothetical protein
MFLSLCSLLASYRENTKLRLRLTLALTILLSVQSLSYPVVAQQGQSGEGVSGHTQKAAGYRVQNQQSQDPVQTSNPSVTLRGRVIDSSTGEPISKVKIVVVGSRQKTTTDEKGAFTLENLPAGEVELAVTTVGYGLLKKSLTLKAGEAATIELPLNSEAAALTEQITVNAGVYAESEANAASEKALNKTELQTLSTVLLGDPLRAAQSLPGVVANDDFSSEFAIRGAGFERLGIYVDGVLTDNFVHTIQGRVLDAGSLSIINVNTISAVTLFSAAYPANYGNSTAAALNLETREGNRVKPSGRISSSLSSTTAVLDGPFAGARGAWLFAARKSYLGYLARRVSDANEISATPIMDFADVQGKAVSDISSRQQVGISAIFGSFRFDRNRTPGQLDANRLLQADSRNLLVNAHWNYAANSQFFSQTRVFAVRTNFANTNPDGVILEEGRRSQFGVRSDLNILARRAHRIEAGIYVRAIGAERFSQRFRQIGSPDLLTFHRRATEQSVYGQDTWRSEELGLSVTGGGRVEHSGLTGETYFSPRASLALALGKDWRLRAGLGRHYQFPDFERLFGRLGNPALGAERATHYNVSIERTFGSKTRLLAEAYDREDRNLLFSLSEPRLENGQVTFSESAFRNSLAGYARGLELSLQRRSANGFSGWLAYSYSKTGLTDEQTGHSFPSDFDQRHTLSLYGSYRLTETFHLSSGWRYGSGLPVPGFFRERGADIVLAGERNLIRLPVFSRLDVRANKVFLFNRWKLTLYGEVLNVLNRGNERFVGLDGIAPGGKVFLGRDKLLPILPSAGIAIEF